MRKPIKTYYILFTKKDNRVFITTYKSIISRTLNIHLDTLSRHLKNNSFYETEEFIVWKDIKIHKRATGFRVRKRDIRNTSSY